MAGESSKRTRRAAAEVYLSLLAREPFSLTPAERQRLEDARRTIGRSLDQQIADRELFELIARDEATAERLKALDADVARMRRGDSGWEAELQVLHERELAMQAVERLPGLRASVDAIKGAVAAGGINEGNG